MILLWSFGAIIHSLHFFHISRHLLRERSNLHLYIHAHLCFYFYFHSGFELHLVDIERGCVLWSSLLCRNCWHVGLMLEFCIIYSQANLIFVWIVSTNLNILLLTVIILNCFKDSGNISKVLKNNFRLHAIL